MALFKCKSCGGEIQPNSDGYTGVCLYCGSAQTLPKDKDEKIANLLNRANDFRLKSDFDRAIFEYEKVLELDETEPEAHWGVFLSRYGVEYVKDTMTLVYKPTLHRISSVSVYDDVDYQAAIKYASFSAAQQYKVDAEHIELVMKELLLLSANQEPYDIFLSYKELDDVTRQRTDDSYLAHDLYNELTAQGYKVFFAPKSLIGVALYEPKIYSAIISSKVMIVLGTKPQYLEGVWVKNEWSRFDEAIERGEDKIIIPVFKNMEAGQMPSRLSKYNAYDMSSLTFLENIKQIISEKVSSKTDKSFGKDSSSEAAFLERGFLALEDRDFKKADSFLEEVLNINPHNSRAYLGKLLVEIKATNEKQIIKAPKNLSEYTNFDKALRFADQQTKTILLQYEEKVKYTLDEQVYDKAMALINNAQVTESDCSEAAELFESISQFKDAKDKVKFCHDKKEGIKKDAIFLEAVNLESLMHGDEEYNYEAAVSLYKKIPGWRDADVRLEKCKKRLEEIAAEEEEKCRQEEIINIKESKRRKKGKFIKIIAVITVIALVVAWFTVINPARKYNKAIELLESGKYQEAITVFESLDDYKDSADKIKECYDLIIKNCKVGDIIYFGSYEQDNDSSNGKEMITWRVLDIQDGKALVVSEYCLDCQPYHSDNEEVTWETCTIRQWLNDDFLNAAFTTQEQSSIVTSTVPAHSNPSYDVYQGNDTEDKVFLLSIQEVNEYFDSDEAKKSSATVYAEAQGSYTKEYYDKTTYWWLRTVSPQDYNHYYRAAYVYAPSYGNDDSVYEEGTDVDSMFRSVRPAMWIEIG